MENVKLLSSWWERSEIVLTRPWGWYRDADCRAQDFSYKREYIQETWYNHGGD